MRRTRWSAVMSVTVATTPFVWVSPAFLQVGMCTVSQEKLPVDTGLGGHRNLRASPCQHRPLARSSLWWEPLKFRFFGDCAA